MVDVLVRNIPDPIVSAIDAQAEQAGVSRVEFLRRVITEQARRHHNLGPIDWSWFAEATTDLADPDLRRQAWE
jgi:hypothetical protein